MYLIFIKATYSSFDRFDDMTTVEISYIKDHCKPKYEWSKTKIVFLTVGILRKIIFSLELENGYS